MRTVRLPGMTAALRFCEIPGEPPAIVFLTGMGLSSVATFLDTVPARLPGRRRLIFVDSFGSGFSDAPTEFGYTLTEHADSIAALLGELGLGVSDIVGFSMGGSIAVVFADTHPRLVRGLVVAEANLDQGGGTLSPSIARQTEAEFAETGHAALLESLRDEAERGNQGIAALHAFLSRAPSHALHRNASALTRPLDRSVRDRLEAYTGAKVYLAGSLPGAEYPGAAGPLTSTGVSFVEAAGHLLMWDNPAGWTAALDAALSAVSDLA